MSRGTGLALVAVVLCGAAAAGSAVARAENDEPRPEEQAFELLSNDGAHLGVMLKDVEKDDLSRLKLDAERGVLVTEVREDTPAQKAGLKPDDVILRYQGENVHSAAQLRRLVRETPPGRTVSIEVSRAGVVQRLSATLEQRRGFGWLAGSRFPNLDIDLPAISAPRAPRPPRAPGAFVLRDIIGDRAPRKLGIRYQEIDGQLAKYFRLAEESGVLVTSVEADSPASQAGLKAGDVILKLAGKSIRDADDLADEVRRAEPGQEVALSVQRDGKPVELKLKVAGERRARRRVGPTI
jgi:S1-C subfamily serine protease